MWCVQIEPGFIVDIKQCLTDHVFWGGTTAAAPPPFRPGNPAFFGSCPLVTPCYCRLGDLLCLYVYPLFIYYFVCVCNAYVYFVFSLCFFGVIFLCSFLLQYFDTVGWVFWPVNNRRPYNLYCVGAVVILNQSTMSFESVVIYLKLYRYLQIAMILADSLFVPCIYCAVR